MPGRGPGPRPGSRGPAGIALVLGVTGGPQEFPALRRFGEFAGPRLPPFSKLLLQVDGPEFYIREPFITILDKVFELLVRRYHP